MFIVNVVAFNLARDVDCGCMLLPTRCLFMLLVSFFIVQSDTTPAAEDEMEPEPYPPNLEKGVSVSVFGVRR